MNMHKFTEGKGKAFSYFSIVAKNYLILHNNNNYKKLKQTDDESVTDYKRDALWETKRADILEGKKEYMDLFVEYWSNNLTTVFKRKQDIDVANSVLYLMEQRENIENFNKKALYATQIRLVYRIRFQVHHQLYLSRGVELKILILRP